MLVGIAQQIPHPTEPGRTLWDARLDTGPYKGSMTKGLRYNTSLFAATRSLDTLRVGDLGSGSDFTVFFHHLGVMRSHFLQRSLVTIFIRLGFEHIW